MSTPTPPKPWMHDLWAHLHNEHGLTLVESEIFEIVRLAAPPVTCRTCQHWNEQSEGFGTCGNAKHLDLLRVLGSYMLVHAAFGCVMHESRKQSGTAEIQTPVAAAPGWQHIETLSEPDQDVLLWGMLDCETCPDCHKGCLKRTGYGHTWFESVTSPDGCNRDEITSVTHWMPLPTPPQV